MTVRVAESSWNPVGLLPYLDSEYVGFEPTLLTKTDGRALLYPGAVHSIAGEPGSGKSWVALVAAKEVLQNGGAVLYVDFEDSARTAVHRLRTLGVGDAEITVSFGYVRPDEPLRELPDVLAAWLDVVDLVILDGVTNALQIHNLDPLSNRDTAEFMNEIVGRLGTGRTAPAILLIDHVAKARSNQRGPVGAQHKVAAVQVQYKVQVVRAFDQNHDGEIALVLTKDRFGEVQRHLAVSGPRAGRAARIAFTHDPSLNIMRSAVLPPETSHAHRFDGAKRAILELVGTTPGIKRTDLVKRISMRDAHVGQAIDELVESLDLSEERDGRSRTYALAPASTP